MSMGHKGFILTPAEVEQWWDKLLPLVEDSVRAGAGTITTEQIYKDGVTGLNVIIGTALEGKPVCVCVAKIMQYPGYKVCFVEAIAGDLRRSLNYMPLLKEWALQNGADKIEGLCPPAVARLLPRYGPWSPKFILMEYDLKRTLQ